MSYNLHHILPYTSPPQFRPFTNWIMAWPFYCNPSFKFFKMCVMHHQQTTYASIWNTVDEFWLLLHPTQCFQLFRERRWCFVRQLGDWNPPQLNRKVICPLNWGESEREFGTAVLSDCQDYRWDWQRANRTCLSIIKEKKSKTERANIQTVSDGQGLWCVIIMWRWTMTEVDSSEMKNGNLMGQCWCELSIIPFTQCSLFSEMSKD